MLDSLLKTTWNKKIKDEDFYIETNFCLSFTSCKIILQTRFCLHLVIVVLFIRMLKPLHFVYRDCFLTYMYLI